MTQAGGEDRFSRRLTHGAPLAVLLAFGILTAYQLLPVLKVIAVAILVALVLRTVVDALEEWGTPAWLSVVILLAIIAAVGALVVLFIIPNLRGEIHTLLSNGPGSLRSLEKPMRKLPFIPDPSQIMGRLKGSLTAIIGSLPSLVSLTVSLIVALISAVFLALYLAVSPRTYVSGVLRLMPRERRPAMREFIYRVGKRLRGWIFGTAIIASFIGVGGGLGLRLLGVPLPVTFGILAGLLDVVPFLGSVLGGLLPALLALTISPLKAVEVVVLFFVLNQIEGNILQPRIMGREVHVPGGVIIVSFLVMGTLVGPVVGTFLSVPTAVFLSVLIDEMTEREPHMENDVTKE